MKMEQYGADSLKDIVDFVNRKGITKSNIVSIIPQESGTYTLIYFDAK